MRRTLPTTLVLVLIGCSGGAPTTSVAPASTPCATVAPPPGLDSVGVIS